MVEQLEDIVENVPQQKEILNNDCLYFYYLHKRSYTSTVKHGKFRSHYDMMQ